MVLALHLNSTSCITKDGIFPVHPYTACSYCVSGQPLTLFHFIYDCEVLNFYRSKHLQLIPIIPIDQIYLLTGNLLKGIIFKLYSYMSDCMNYINHAFL